MAALKTLWRFRAVRPEGVGIDSETTTLIVQTGDSRATVPGMVSLGEVVVNLVDKGRFDEVLARTNGITVATSEDWWFLV